ncbi:GNAT family N-acetyltransferase [Angustibacter sp. McL0619]|uniref:GNAT family N-acetyltransferase n=1 Tax=Angustibacter sp. McL0619 TaxID=3415676 RepID=UPI003CEA3BE0
MTAPTGQLVRLFDEYREHYGARPDPAGSRTWLLKYLSSGALVAFVANRDDEAAGLALVAPIPASQRLGHFWQLRDLFVAPRHRRVGVGKALLKSVCGAAQENGAARLSLVTESDNGAALELYANAGFEPVSGYTSMSWSPRAESDGFADR